MKLILTVSAECIPQEVGFRDSDRILTTQGGKDILDAAEFLNRLDISPVLVLSGPFERTKQTGEILSANFEISPPVEIVPGLMPGADAGELIKAVTNRAKCDTRDWIAVVIHYSDTELVLREILGLKEMTAYPVSPGLIIGINLKCIKSSLSGEILFSKYPRKF